MKSISSQTYPSNLELQFEDLLTAFQSMESQVLNIVQKSYQEQRDSDFMVYKTEIKRLEDKEIQMEEMLKREKKEREKVQRELKSITEAHKSCDRQSSQALAYEEKNIGLEAHIQCLKEQNKQDMVTAKAQEGQIVALRKMSESTKRCLEYMTGRITQMNREMQTLQERNARLSENELSRQEEIKELKRQIAIRDDRITQLGGDGLQTVTYTNKRKELSDNKTVKVTSQKDQTAGKERTNIEDGSADDLIYIDTFQGQDRTTASTKKVIEETDSGKDRSKTSQNKAKIDILIIGTSIIKDVDPERMYKDNTVKKHTLEQEAIAGAKRYVSDLTGELVRYYYKSVPMILKIAL